MLINWEHWIYLALIDLKFVNIIYMNESRKSMTYLMLFLLLVKGLYCIFYVCININNNIFKELF